MMAQKMWHERHDSVALGMMKRWRREDEARLRKRLAELRARVIPVYFVEDAVGKPNVEAIALQDEMFELKAEIAAIERQLSYEPEAEEIHECHPVREFLKTARVVLVDLGRTTAMRHDYTRRDTTVRHHETSHATARRHNFPGHGGTERHDTPPHHMMTRLDGVTLPDFTRPGMGKHGSLPMQTRMEDV